MGGSTVVLGQTPGEGFCELLVSPSPPDPESWGLRWSLGQCLGKAACVNYAVEPKLPGCERKGAAWACGAEMPNVPFSEQLP